MSSYKKITSGRLYASLNNTGKNNTSGFSPLLFLCLKSHFKYLINVLNINFSVVKVITGYIFFSAGQLPVCSYLKMNISSWQFQCVKFFHSIKIYTVFIYFVVKGYFSLSEKISVLVISNHDLWSTPIIKWNNLLKFIPWDLPFLLTVLWSCLPGDEISLTVTPKLNIFPSSLQYLLALKVQPYLCWKKKGKKSPCQIQSVFNVWLYFNMHTKLFYINLKNAPKFYTSKAS